MEDAKAALAEVNALLERTREMVAAQRRRVERLQTIGRSTELAERLLALFEESLAMRESQRDELSRRAEIPKQFRPW